MPCGWRREASKEPLLGSLFIFSSHGLRSQHAVAHVWTLVVVKVHDVGNDLSGLLHTFRSLHPVKPLLFDDSVHPLRNGIVGRLAILSHTYGCADPFQNVDIGIATVLGTAVGVVDQPSQIDVSGLRYALVQGLDGGCGHQRIGQHPAYYLMRKGIRKKVEIAYAFVGVNIGYVRHPQLVGPCRLEVPGAVFILAIVVVGVGCMPSPLGWKHEMMLVQQLVEPVTSHHFLRIDVLQYQKQLAGAYSRCLSAYLRGHLHYGGFPQFTLLQLLLADRVIAFARLAKQSAQNLEGQLALMSEVKAAYCLAPAFF